MGVFTGLIRKDLTLELRKKETLVSMVFFAILLLFIMNMAIGLSGKITSDMAAGTLWIAVLFSSVFGLGRTFAMERSNRCIDGLLVSPARPSSVFMAKMTVNLAFLTIAEMIILPIFFVLYGSHIQSIQLPLVLITVILNLGLSSVGTLISGITAGSSRNEVLLPILLFPLITPLLAFTIKATGVLFGGASFEDYEPWLYLMAAFALIFSTAGYYLFGYILEEN
jgi:heme exporter protein B